VAQVIPLQAVPSQRLDTVLGNQLVTVILEQKTPAMFVQVYINNALIIGGVICQNKNRIVRDAYLGFVGDLVFIDTQGTNDPTYTGLGTRFFLVYLDVADLPIQGIT
jgi:hypothetical protein